MKLLIKKKTEPTESAGLDRFRKKKKIKRWIGLAILLLLIIPIWYGATALVAFNRATVSNTTTGQSILKNATTNKEITEPINILLIGVGGESHPGGTLADSIMVASIDTKTKNVSLLSLPRDLYVDIPGHGKDKINAAHSFGENNKKNQGGGPAVLKEVVATTLGVPVHYFVRIDFDGFKKIIDTVGGVTVDVKKAINDPLYPDAQMRGYDPFSISAGSHNLDGKTALKYVRSRETTSDFDRARRQQQVISALKDKILSAQVLANPKKVTDIITVLGQHLLTDLSAKDMEQLVKIGKDFTNPTFNSYVIDTSENSLLTSSRSSAGASILVPKAGANDFTEIQLFADAYFAAPRIKSEKPTVLIERATGVTKDTATKVVKILEAAGFTVTQSETTVADAKTGLATYTTSKPNSTTFFKTAYNLVPTKGPSTAPTTDFVLTLGTDFSKVVKTHVQAQSAAVQDASSPLSIDGTTSTGGSSKTTL